MPEYLLHRNGRGRLYDDAEANRAVYISKDSSASGSAKLRDCRLVEGSRAEGECQIYGGDYFGSLVTGCTITAGSPYVCRSELNCSEVSGRAVIHSSQLLDGTEVCDAPIIRDAILRDAIVYGQAVIWSQSRDEVFRGRIHEGIWYRPPKHIKLPWCDLSECVDGKVLLDCRCRSAAYWHRHGPKLARRWGWSEDMISVTLDTIQREFAENLTTNKVYTSPHGDLSIPTSLTV